MTQTLVLTPRDRRSAAFFWLGVGVFPVFWSWFTLGKKFASWQRYLALGWMVIALAVFALTWPRMTERYELLLLALPLLSLLVTLGLCLWLAFRFFSFFDWFLIYIVAGGVAPLQFDRLMAYAVEQDFSCKWAMLPLVPAFLHLLTAVSQAQQPPPEGDTGGKAVP